MIRHSALKSYSLRDPSQPSQKAFIVVQPTTRSICCAATSGSGPNALSAFHSALMSLGIGHLNLVRLSSVVPYKWQVKAADRSTGLQPQRAVPGDRLYCVYADAYALEGCAAAALAWSVGQTSQFGYFAEAGSRSKLAALDEVHHTLDQMRKYHTDEIWISGEVSIEVSANSEGTTCALAVAAFGTESW